MTIANIDTDYDARTGVTTNWSDTATICSVVGNGSASSRFRSACRFPLSGVTPSSTVNDVDLQVNVTAAAVALVLDIYPYNGDADRDPSLDTTAATLWAAIGTGTPLITSSTLLQASGSQTVDLGATADSILQGNISSPAIFSLGFKAQNEATVASTSFEAIENAGTDPATLTVDYTAPAAGTTRLLSLTGAGT